MVKVEIFSSKKFLLFSPLQIRRLIKKAAQIIGKDNFQISVCLIKKEEMFKLNMKFQGKNKSTTVLSFTQPRDFVCPKNFLPHKGEIFLNFSSIKKEAKVYNISPKDYAIKILIHGFLHLMGFGHHNNKSRAIMEKKEKEVLTKLGAK